MIIVQLTARVMQVGDGPGGAYLLGQNQSENPGFGSALGAGEIPSAQYLELRVGELVPGGDSPTSGNFTTVFTTLASDLGTLMSTAGAYSGGTQTPLAIVQGWSTGNP